MKPVFQSCVDKNKGDCLRAVVASVFDLELDQVPHFGLFEKGWFNVYYYFLLGMGYQFKGTCHLKCRKKLFEKGIYKDINGVFIGTVPSKSFKNRRHAVVINKDGLIIHDPNPNKLWLNINVIEKNISASIDNLDVYNH